MQGQGYHKTESPALMAQVDPKALTWVKEDITLWIPQTAEAFKKIEKMVHKMMNENDISEENREKQKRGQIYDELLPSGRCFFGLIKFSCCFPTHSFPGVRVGLRVGCRGENKQRWPIKHLCTHMRYTHLSDTFRECTKYQIPDTMAQMARQPIWARILR